MTGVCVSGARGRMGRMLVELVDGAEDLSLAAALERPAHPELGVVVAAGVELVDDPESAIRAADVLLDFSLPGSVAAHVRIAADAGKAVVAGTTGLDEEQMDALRTAASRVAVVHGSNMSRGVFVLTELVRAAARCLSGDYDVEIVEAHHRAKRDSPSGTAWQLAETVRSVRGGETVYGRAARRGPGEIGLSALRGGDVVGEHQVWFFGPGEQIGLTHRATTREHFCRGALAAVRFARGKEPGIYTMADVFSVQGLQPGGSRP